MPTTETRWISAKMFEVTAGMSDEGKEAFYLELILDMQRELNKISAAKWVREGHSFRQGMDNDA